MLPCKAAGFIPNALEQKTPMTPNTPDTPYATPNAPSGLATIVCLALGVLVPVVYFGIQIVGSLFWPGYSWVRNVASEFGSPMFEYCRAFNVGVIAFGVLLVFSSIGFWSGMRRAGVHALLTIPACLGVIGMCVQAAWAGWYPMPDPRHGGHPAFVLAMLSTPMLLSVVLWRLGGSVLKGYIVVNLAVLVVMVPIMSGVTTIDRGAYAGLLQRVLTAAVFIPVGVAALRLLMHRGPRPVAAS